MRPGRATAEQGKKGLSLCRKLNSFMRIVHGTQLTDNPSTGVRMKCAVGMMNDLLKPSHFYDIMCNLKYTMREQFICPETYRWLDENTSELGLLSDAVPVDMDANTPLQKLCGEQTADVIHGNQQPVSQHTSQPSKKHICSCCG